MSVSIVTRPDATTPVGAKTGRFLAVNADYDVPFELRREDYSVIAYNRLNDNTLKAIIIDDLSNELVAGDVVYFHSEQFPYIDGSYTIKSISFGGSTSISTVEEVRGTWSADAMAGAYVNLITTRLDHHVEITVWNSSTLQEIGTANYTAFNSGLLKFDCSPWVKRTLAINKDFTSLPSINTETTLRFYISWKEIYGGNAFEEETIDTVNYYAVSGAMQVQELYAPNLLSHTFFNANLDEEEKAVFLSEFAEPIYFQGYPFKMGILGEMEGGYPLVTREEEKFDQFGVSQGTTSTDLVAPNWNYMNFVPNVGNYADDISYIYFWLEVEPTPLNSCSRLTAADWKYQSWVVNGAYVAGVYIEPNTPASNIATIVTRPAGKLYRDAVEVDDLIWNGTLGYYVPSTGDANILFTGTMTADVNAIGLTTTAGESCSLDFEQDAESNSSPPIAQSIFLSVVGGGHPDVGSQIQLNYTYFDNDGNPEGNSIRAIRVYVDEATADTDTDGTGGTEVTTDSGQGVIYYTILAADQGKVFKGWVTPISTVEPTTGTITPSNVLGPVVTTIISYTHNKQTNHALDIAVTSGQEVIIDWGDGSTQNITGNGLLNSYLHTYLSPGTNEVKVLGDPANLRQVKSSNNGILTADLTNGNYLVLLNLSNNSGLTSFQPPTNHTGSFVVLDIQSTGIVGALDLTNLTFSNANILFHLCGSITSFDLTGSTGTIESFRADFCNLTGNMVIPSGLNMRTGAITQRIRANDNPLLTGFDCSNMTGDCTDFQFQNCNITGNFNFGLLNFKNNTILYVNDNALLTGWDLSGNSGKLREFKFNNCDITGTQDIPLEFEGTAGIFAFGNNTAFDLDFTGSGGTMVNFRVHTCNYTGALNLPAFVFSAAVFTTNNTSNLTSIDFSLCTGSMFICYLYTSGLAGALDFANLTWNAGYIRYENTDVTSVDHTGNSGNLTMYKATNANLTGTLTLPAFVFNSGSICEINSNPLLTEIDFSAITGTISRIRFDTNDLDTLVDLSNPSLNFNSADSELYGMLNPDLPGVKHHATQTGGFKTYHIYDTSCVLQTNDFGTIEFEADCNFEFFNNGLAAGDVDNFWIAAEAISATSGASGSYEGGGDNAAPTAASATERSDLAAAGYTVISS